MLRSSVYTTNSSLPAPTAGGDCCSTSHRSSCTAQEQTRRERMTATLAWSAGGSCFSACARRAAGAGTPRTNRARTTTRKNRRDTASPVSLYQTGEGPGGPKGPPYRTLETEQSGELDDEASIAQIRESIWHERIGVAVVRVHDEQLTPRGVLPPQAEIAAQRVIARAVLHKPCEEQTRRERVATGSGSTRF